MLKKHISKNRIVFITTFPPRECGIATYSQDLVRHLDDLFVPGEEAAIFALTTSKVPHRRYPAQVIGEISENCPSDYTAAAERINADPTMKIVSVQHEFGIFGDNYGANIVLFFEALKKPAVTTFHTVLPLPPLGMKKIMRNILSHTALALVMTESSKKLLEKIYQVPTEKIRVIPHGVHDVPFTDGMEAKKILGLSGKKILSTFGLLGRGKGVEYGIRALSRITHKHPEARYVVIGATHPEVVRREGESYRRELIKLATELGVRSKVIFYNTYVTTPELLNFLQATDVYFSLSQNPDQAVSGTLSYALGSGRPVISTAFRQAKEIVTTDVGALVPFNDSAEIARQAIKLLDDEPRRIAMAKNAYFKTRGMTWHNVVLSYLKEFETLSPSLRSKEKKLPPLTFAHLRRLTDAHGIFQFAILNDPDPSWGYTLDDNARALVAVCWQHARKKTAQHARLAEIYLAFIEHVAQEKGGFINYLHHDKTPHATRNQEENLDDAYGRALWALGVAAHSNLPAGLRKRASKLFSASYAACDELTSPRAVAYIIKSLALFPRNKKITEFLQKKADWLVERYEKSSTPSWQWFERALTYSNAVLSEALFFAYHATGKRKYLSIARSSLDFLVGHSFVGTMCVPIGQNGWFVVGGKKALFDQQPEEVSALVLALRSAYNLCGDKHYAEWMRQAFDWFLGNNVRCQVVCSVATGGCFDGLGEKAVNLNQGAESTVSYLLARLAIEG